MDRKFVISGLGYAVLGLILGIYMAASKDHGQLVTHSHFMLVGFVLSFVYGLCHKLWLNNATTNLANAQFYIHQIGTAGLLIGLFLLYGRLVDLSVIDPVLGISSIAVFIGVVLMSILFLQSGTNSKIE